MFHLVKVSKVEKNRINMYPTYVFTQVINNEVFVVDSSSGDILLSMSPEAAINLATEITMSLVGNVPMEATQAQAKLLQTQEELSTAKTMNEALNHLLVLEAQHNDKGAKNG